MKGVCPLFFILYDGIEHSIFESQVLTPLLKRLAQNKKLFISLVSFERNVVSPQKLSHLSTLHPRLTVTTFKRGPFLGIWSLQNHASLLRKSFTYLKDYHVIARGPLAGLIATKALTSHCKHFTLQARGLLAEEYRYTHRYVSSWVRWIYWLRAYQLEYWEKKAYSNSIKTNFSIEVVSTALQEYLIKHYHVGHQSFSLAQLDMPESLPLQKQKQDRTAIRKKLKIPDSAHVYVYNGSAHSWQCPTETILFFKSQLKDNSDSFLLLLTTQPKTFKRLCEKNKLPQKVHTILNISPSDVLSHLCAADTGLLFREKHIINWVSRPTKYLEYKAANLFIAHNKTIGLLEQES